MPKKLIRVTETFIREGQARHPGRCPIARAVAASGLSLSTGAGIDSIGVEVGSRSYEIPTPPKVKAFMLGFDVFESGQPFNFYLEVPSE